MQHAAEEFYRMRIRDAVAYDAPQLRLIEFFGEDASDIVELEWAVPGTDILMVHRALEFLLRDWDHLGDAPSRGNLFHPLPRRSLQVATKKWDFVIDEAHRFWIGPDEMRLCVNCQIDDFTSGPIGSFGFNVHQRHHEVIRDLWVKVDKWMTANHYLRGQKIDSRGQFLELPETNAWEELVLSDDTRQRIENNTVRLIEERERFTAAGIPLKRGIILYGAPGTGKTMIGRALAQRWPGTFVLVTPGALEDAESMTGIFKLARRLAPTLLFIEDLDLIGPSRHRDGDTEILGEMLSALDGLDSKEGIITVATTNDLTAIEPALKDRPSRFDIVLEIPPLEEQERRIFLERWLSARQHERIMLDPMIEKTKGFTGAQMQELCRSATIESLKEQASPPVLKQEHWTAALAMMHPGANKSLGFR